MNLSVRRSLAWPLALAVAFFAIPILLAISYPASFWMGADYETLGLADALNMAYRLADRQMYEAVGMAYHPGVPFYLMNWLALALAGYPVASGEINFFDTVMNHVGDFHRMFIGLGALTGAVGVYVFGRAAQKLVPVGVTATGLLLWLFSTPATLLMFMSPGIESFAIIINGLFLAVMVPLAYEKDVDPSIVVFAGCVAAFAYLNKLSYIYIPLALYAAILAKLLCCRPGWLRGALLLTVFLGTLVLVVLAVAFLIIGWDGFRDVWRYHQSVIWGSELYGTGAQTVVSKSEVWRAIATIPADRAYAVPIALIGGAILVIGAIATWIKQAEQAPVAILSFGTGIAAILSALTVLKHYELHYTAAVSATLPSCVVCLYLLARPWGAGLRLIGATLAVAAVLFMARQTTGPLIDALSSKTSATALAKADLEEINSYLAGSNRAVEFAYKTPFQQYGEGFIVYYGSVPRMTYDYFRSRQLSMSSTLAGMVSRDVGAYVIDKSYFRDVASVKAAANLALSNPKPVRFKDGDRLIELRTVFLLIRG